LHHGLLTVFLDSGGLIGSVFVWRRLFQ
jgi:hypothetical protein